jgi:hypothetical protein
MLNMKSIVVNLNDPTPSLEQEFETKPNLIKDVMNFHNLFSLPHLPARRTIGKIHLVDYSQSHVVTFVDYLVILKKKVLNKATT